jgi:plasmid stabilization system protein ParE
MRIRWTPPAAADMQSITEYLKESSALSSTDDAQAQ